jgi:hypothetical protein
MTHTQEIHARRAGDRYTTITIEHDGMPSGSLDVPPDLTARLSDDAAKLLGQFALAYPDLGDARLIVTSSTVAS